MRCRRIQRELVWLARFGEFGPSSAPHLEHLSYCRECRDEVGFDRALVQQLRLALLERTRDAAPSSEAWSVILRRSQQPEPGRAERVLGWFGVLATRLRVSTAMAGSGLALVLALNMQVVPVTEAPSTDDGAAAEVTQLQQVPRLPLGTGARTMDPSTARVVVREPPDPEAAMVHVRSRIPALQPAVVEPEPPVEEASGTDVRVVFRPFQTPEPAGDRSATRQASADEPVDDAAGAPIQTIPGEPS